MSARPLDRLTDTAQSLLDPLLGADDPRRVAQRLADGIRICAATADSFGLRGLNYLSALLAPFLSQKAVEGFSVTDRECAQRWVTDVVAFCAGQLEGRAVKTLVEQLADWPGFAKVPGQFVALIGERLRSDAEIIRAWPTPADAQAQPAAAVSPVVAELPADAEGTTPAQDTTVAEDAAVEGDAAVEEDATAAEPPEPQTPSPSAQPAGATAATSTVARDELAMLAEAADSLSADAVPQLLSNVLPPEDEESLRAWRDTLDEYAGRIGHLGNAVGFVGLGDLAGLLEVLSAQIESWRAHPSLIDEHAQRLLMLAPDALARYFTAPDSQSAGELAGLFTDPGWPQPLSETAARRFAGGLSQIFVIESRQVLERDDDIDPADLALDIPADADRSVVDNLLRELPLLSAEFSSSIEALRAGSKGELDRSQRLAHTLKGSANTVGIRGVANLTHQLEDVLQLLVKADRLPPRALVDQLAEAADCLAEMCEAVAGMGPPPAHAADVFRAVVMWTNRLIRDGVPDEDLVDDSTPVAPVEPTTGARSVAAAQDPLVTVTDPASARTSVPAADADAGAGVHARAQADAHPQSDAVAQAEALAQADTAGQAHADPHADAQANADAHRAHAAATAGAGTIGAPEPVRGAVAVPQALAQPAPAAQEGGADADELLRVPAGVINRLLDFAGEAVIALAQMQEQIASLGETRSSLRAGSERLQDLSSELERLVDVRGLALTDRSRQHDFDALELDEYNDLHTVSRRIAEAGADNKLVDQLFDRQVAVLSELAAQLERAQTDLREAALQTRTVTVATVTGRLQRATRQAARMAGKLVELKIIGQDTPLDSQLLQGLVDPLTHLLRNAVDHGIEPDFERVRLGKAMAGVIELSFERDAGNLVIRCRDDGRGLDLAAIRQRARDQGLIQASDNPADAELARLILQPGFSTRTETTQLSGRGIGLDVVAQSMRDLRGRIDIGFVPGEGTHFLLTVPVRMATIPVMVARAPTHVLALSVREVEQIVAADGLFVDAAGTARCQLGDTVLQAVRLESLLRLPERALWVEGVNEIVLIVRQGAEAPVAVVTPELGQTRNVILRPLPGFVPAIAGIEGLAVLGDGAVAPVVDLPELLAHRNDDAPQYASMLTSEANIAPICLVVDDSVSVRRSMELFIRDLGLQVDTAGDGLEALARVNKRRPDLAIVDLEMPRMNGVELTSALRADPQTAQLPIIMITSRFSEKHKQLAQAAGVDVFLTKPYTEDELAAEIQRCLFRAAH